MNEVTSPNSQLPAYLQASLAAHKPSTDSASMATAQNSVPRLSLRAKVFRFMEGQDEVYKNKDQIEVYIVGVEPGPGLFTKTWYAKPYAGSDSAGEPPDCSSADGLRPDPWINQPVSPDCKGCPKNQFGSATSRKGKPAKACADSKRLMIARADVGNPITDKLYTEQVPVSSLEALATFGKGLQSMGVEPWMVRTKQIFVEDAEFPELKFEVAGFIDEKYLEPMRERAAKREWQQSRNIMLQSQASRPPLPPHIAAALGHPPASAAAPAAAASPAVAAMNPAEGNVLHPAVDPAQVAAAQAAAGGPPPSNEDVLKNW